MRKSGSQSNIRQIVLAVVLIALIITASFSAGLLASTYLPIFTSIKDFPVLMEAYTHLSGNYLEELPKKKILEYGMIHGLIDSVGDPYSVFLEPVQHELQTNQLDGSFGGIGARLEWDTEGYLILFPFPESTSQKSGIHEGDRLVAVDSLQITPGMPVDEIQAAIRGPVGEALELTIARAPDYLAINIQVEREEVALPSVTWNLAPQNGLIGIIQINIIAATTPDEVATAILDLQSRAAQYFILDLRNNSGGLLHSGVDTAQLFLEKTVILQQQYGSKPVEDISGNEDGEFQNIPLIVLVNHNSASAAEIVAGALQAHDRAKIIGTNTYGKDTIQLVFDLSDGSSLHVTSARWWIPGLGYAIHAQGLIPDIELSEEEITQPQAIDIAIEQLIN
jgi:carboxyl-terminal processing protease